MLKILYLFFFVLVVSNCSFKKVVKHHGVPFLEKKQKELIIDQSTSNDIRKILGTPSTRSKFDNDIWIYIERKQTQSELKNLGSHTETGESLIVKDGRYGPYITDGKINASIPSDIEVENITLEEAVGLINKKRLAPPRKKRVRKKKKK